MRLVDFTILPLENDTGFIGCLQSHILEFGSIRTGFEFLAQRVDELRPKKPKTMNL